MNSYDTMNRCVSCNRWYPKDETRCGECHQRLRTRSHWSGSESKFLAYYRDVKVVIHLPKLVVDLSRCSVVLTLPQVRIRS